MLQTNKEIQLKKLSLSILGTRMMFPLFSGVSRGIADSRSWPEISVVSYCQPNRKTKGVKEERQLSFQLPNMIIINL